MLTLNTSNIVLSLIHWAAGRPAKRTPRIMWFGSYFRTAAVTVSRYCLMHFVQETAPLFDRRPLGPAANG